MVMDLMCDGLSIPQVMNKQIYNPGTNGEERILSSRPALAIS